MHGLGKADAHVKSVPRSVGVLNGHDADLVAGHAGNAGGRGSLAVDPEAGGRVEGERVDSALGIGDYELGGIVAVTDAAEASAARGQLERRAVIPDDARGEAI
ncbi:MAG TPA: hypothetical protein VG815_02405 [Chloroflexota bacterium]|nr:hypothetical protein [Chloroflexota bacterium]